METEELFKDDQSKENKPSKKWLGVKGEGDIVLSILIIIFAVLMFIGTQYFPHRAGMGFVTSARFTPMLLSVLVIILCCVLIIGTIRKYGKVSIAEWFHEMIVDETIRRSFVLMAIIGVYILLIGRIHFIVINILFLFVIYWYLKVGSWKMIIIYAVANGLFVSVVVPYIFQLPLP